MNLAHSTPQAAEADGRPKTDPLSDAFARWQGELLGTLYHLVGNAEDARDALQETFLKCWRHRDEVEGVGNLKAWIFRIALNTGRDLRGAAWRRRRVPLSEDGLMLLATNALTEDRLERAEQLEGLRRAVHELRSEEQEVFLLRQNGEMTYDDIAQALGIPVGTLALGDMIRMGRLRRGLHRGEKAGADVAFFEQWEEQLDHYRFPVRQYAQVHTADPEGARRDFTETLYWNPLLLADANGRAELTFDVSDAVTAFRVTADAHDGGGRIGSGKAEIISRIPFHLEPKLPLEELKKAGAIDYYETRPREVICYWRSLAPKREITIGLDLIAEIPGRYTAPASRAYLYYTAERKCWAEPLVVEVGK